MFLRFLIWLSHRKWGYDVSVTLLYWPLRLLFGLRTLQTENLPKEGPFIIAANHASHFDGHLLGFALYRFYSYPHHVLPVFWQGTLKIPFVGPTLQAYGGFPIFHGRGHEKQRSSQIYAILNALHQGKSIQIHPEGGPREALGVFADSAAYFALESGAPIVPCSLLGVHSLFKNYPKPDRFWGRVVIVFHKPIDPAPFRALSNPKEAKKALTKAVRDAIASNLDYPVAELDPEKSTG